MAFIFWKILYAWGNRSGAVLKSPENANPATDTSVAIPEAAEVMNHNKTATLKNVFSIFFAPPRALFESHHRTQNNFPQATSIDRKAFWPDWRVTVLLAK
jgi:hypothetical protein